MPLPSSIHQLRAKCQSNGIKFDFADDALILAQKLEQVENASAYKPETVVLHPIIQPEHTQTDEERILMWLDGHIKAGLNVSFINGAWRMTMGKREDTGSLHMPIKHVLAAADRMLR